MFLLVCYVIAENVVYNLIPTAECREATGGTVMLKEQAREDHRKGRKDDLCNFLFLFAVH